MGNVRQELRSHFLQVLDGLFDCRDAIGDSLDRAGDVIELSSGKPGKLTLQTERECRKYGLDLCQWPLDIRTQPSLCKCTSDNCESSPQHKPNTP